MLATALGTVPAIINGKLTPLLRYLEGPIEKPLIHCVTSRFTEDKKPPKKKIGLMFVTNFGDHTGLFNSLSSPSGTWVQVREAGSGICTGVRCSWGKTKTTQSSSDACLGSPSRPGFTAQLFLDTPVMWSLLFRVKTEVRKGFHRQAVRRSTPVLPDLDNSAAEL